MGNDTPVLPTVAFVAGTLGRGGAERQLYFMLRSLVAEGGRPVVACLTQGEHWEEPIRSLGIPVKWVGSSRSPMTRTLSLINWLRAYRPTVVQSAHFHTNLYSSAAAMALGAADIGAIRNDTRWSITSLGRAGPASLHAPRHLAVNSLRALQEAASMGVPHSHLTYLPNVVEPPHVTRRSSTASVNLLCVGRLVEQKRIDRFLRIVHRTVIGNPDVPIRATVVGEGPLRHQLQQQAADLGIGERVEFLVNPVMEDVYRDASILLLTSEFEGTPNVVLEAMASGLPVVAFDVGGVREVITSSDFGVVVPAGDDNAMASELLHLVASPARRSSLGSAARSEVLTTRSTDSLLRHLTALYRRAAVSHRSPLTASRSASPSRALDATKPIARRKRWSQIPVSR